METQDWMAIVQFCTFLLSLFGGGATVPLINRIKNRFNLPSRYVQLVTIGVATFVAILIAIVNGTISPQPWTYNTLLMTMTTVLLGSQAEYFRIKMQQT